MRYLRILNDGSINYPYTIDNLKLDNPNTSFPQNITEDLLLRYNVYTVLEVTLTRNYTKNYNEGTPVLINGSYYQNWIESDASPEEISQRLNDKWVQIRGQRNQSLAECDWTQLPDSPLTPEKKQEWVVYRQELRDITLQPDPFNIVWPIKPS